MEGEGEEEEAEELERSAELFDAARNRFAIVVERREAQNERLAPSGRTGPLVLSTRGRGHPPRSVASLRTH